MSFQHTSFLSFQSPSYHTPFTYFPIPSHFLSPFLYYSSSSLRYTSLRLPAFIVSHFLYLFPSYASYSIATLSIILSPIPSSFSSSLPAWDYFLLLFVFLSYLFLSLFVLSRFLYCSSRLDSAAFLKSWSHYVANASSLNHREGWCILSSLHLRRKKKSSRVKTWAGGKLIPASRKESLRTARLIFFFLILFFSSVHSEPNCWLSG